MIRRLRNGLAQVHRDLRAPLPDERGLSRGARLRLRIRLLAAKYGWKLVVMVLVYYLIRDIALYLLLPYLALNFAW